ncbi:hypothetical protein [Amycolatopsis nigrescens]|uniref:hypothetical protein n=1 Tax=Amycolatopsis nigrescens TaxID=381445 RepID=UPI00036F883C|nr:hypothetical protein [Amycolatopsis nigrescens]
MSSDKAEETPAVDEEADAVEPDAGATEAAESAEHAEETADEPKVPDTTMPRRLVFGAAALATAAFLAAALFGVLWGVAAADDNANRAAEREDVVRVGSAAVLAFTQLDFNRPDEFFDQQVKAATKEIGEQINAGREANKKTLAEAKTVATTKILDLAVDELNGDEGKARFLAAIQVDVKQGDKSSTKPMRLEVTMSRIDENGSQVWKVSGIEQVPVVSAG